MDGRRKGEEEARRASKGLLSALEVGWRWVGGLGLLSALAGEGGRGLVTTCTYPVTRPAIHGGPGLLRTAKALISSRLEQTFKPQDYESVS